MKKTFVYGVLVLLIVQLSGNQALYGGENEAALIPAPKEFTQKQGQFAVPAELVISYNSGRLCGLAKILAELLQIPGKVRPYIHESRTPVADASFVLLVNQVPDAWLGDEGYELTVDKNRVCISANAEAGIFYGIQTIRQLLPETIETKDGLKPEQMIIPCMAIRDVPRYSWRGFMLDESRHFFGRDQVKKILDIMAFYKMNRFHWHLTDEPAWRIEIRKYPNLTTIGGRGSWSDSDAPAGFYTQQEIREIVKYAQARHIVLIPEIDMPGHATAANRAYPEFSGGGTEEHPEFTFNPGREETYEYLENILREIAELFPGPWIHYGGDEVHFGNQQWKSNPDIQALMLKHNLNTLKDVEQYFNRRMAEVINGLGKTTIGWDEIADVGLLPDKSVVMWWRHNIPEQLDNAIKRNFKVVLCPRLPYYFDFVQYDRHRFGRLWNGDFCPLRAVYEFPGMLDGYKPDDCRLTLGIQACLWTERVHNIRRFDFMTFPRLSALAEAAWTCEDKKSYDSYQNRLKVHLRRYDVWKIYYFNPFEPESTPEPEWVEQAKQR